MKTFQTKSTIIENVSIAPDYMMMRLAAPEIASVCLPGQFVHARCSVGTDPLLRRPISIARCNKPNGTITLIYHVRGKGTQALAVMREGTALDILGPLGNGYPLDDATPHVFLVGGGVGVASLIFCAERLKEKGHTLTVMLGAKTYTSVLGVDMLEADSMGVKIATDDGSRGYHGRVTGLLEKELTRDDTTIYSCGPNAMLKAVSAIAIEKKVPCWVSTEAFMGCGMGACMGCVVETTTGRKRACKDGPVFKAAEIVW